MISTLPARAVAAATVVLIALAPTATLASELTLEAVLRSLTEHAPNLRSERAQREAAAAEARAARGAFDPVLTAQARIAPVGYYDPRRVEVALEQPTPVLGASLYAGYRIGRGKIPPYYAEHRTLDRGEVRGGVRLPLLEGRALDERRAGVRTAAADVATATAEYEGYLLELELRAAKAYFTWVAAGHKLRVGEALLALAEQRRSQIETLVAHGAVPPIEARDNERTILERQRQRVSLQRAQESAAIELSLYLRADDGSPRLASEAELPGLPDLSAAELRVPAASGAEARALEARPELTAHAARVARSEVEHALAENRVSPRLDAFGEVSRDFGSGTPALAATLAPAAAEVGVQLSVPVGLRRARGKLAAAEAKLESAREKARYAADQVRTDVRDAHSQLAAARARAELAADGVAVAREVAAGERERFAAGASTLLFVNLREQQASDAELALIDALAEIRYAAVRVRTSEGTSALTSR